MKYVVPEESRRISNSEGRGKWDSSGSQIITRADVTFYRCTFFRSIRDLDLLLLRPFSNWKLKKVVRHTKDDLQLHPTVRGRVYSTRSSRDDGFSKRAYGVSTQRRLEWNSILRSSSPSFGPFDRSSLRAKLLNFNASFHAGSTIIFHAFQLPLSFPLPLSTPLLHSSRIFPFPLSSRPPNLALSFCQHQL